MRNKKIIMLIQVKKKENILKSARRHGGGSHVLMPKDLIGTNVTAFLLKNHEIIDKDDDCLLIDVLEMVNRDVKPMSGTGHIIVPLKWLGELVLVYTTF